MRGKLAKKIRKSVYSGVPEGVTPRDRGYSELMSGQVVADPRRHRYQKAKKTQGRSR